jgi:hypothetical protein
VRTEEKLDEIVARLEYTTQKSLLHSFAQETHQHLKTVSSFSNEAA